MLESSILKGSPHTGHRYKREKLPWRRTQEWSYGGAIENSC
jgi:hypothetical protein